MESRRTRQLLLSLAAAALLASAGTAYLCWRLPLASIAINVKKPPAAKFALRVPPLASFEKLWDRPLVENMVSKPLPAAAISAESSAPPQPPLRLTGTIIEENNSLALLQNNSGAIELKGVGEKIAGVEILKIDSDRIEVRYAGREMVLKSEGLRLSAAAAATSNVKSPPAASPSAPSDRIVIRAPIPDEDDDQ